MTEVKASHKGQRKTVENKLMKRGYGVRLREEKKITYKGRQRDESHKERCM